MNFTFPYILGMSSSQLTFTPSFFRGVGWNHQSRMSSMFIMEYHLSCQTYPIFSLLLFKKGGSAAMTRKASLPGSPESLRPVHSSGVPTCFGFKVGSEWKLLRDMNGLLMDYSGMVFDGFSGSRSWHHYRLPHFERVPLHAPLMVAAGNGLNSKSVLKK